SRRRCSSLRSNSATAAASAPFSFGDSTVPRYWARFLMTDTRQLRSLAAVGFFLAGRNMAEQITVCYYFCYPIRRHAAEQDGIAARLGVLLSPEIIDEMARDGIGRDGQSRICRPLRNHSGTWRLRVE